MGSIRRIIRVCLGVSIGLIVYLQNQCAIDTKGRLYAIRNLSSGEQDDLSVEKRIKSYSSSGSIAAVINTAKMGTGGLYTTFQVSWKCGRFVPKVTSVRPTLCLHDRRTIRTHSFDDGSEYIQKYRKVHPEGKCLIASAIRSPATWFGSMYLQMVHNNWKPKEEMLKDYRKFLAEKDFHMVYQVLPDLLEKFNAGSLVEQSKIMDYNGGYSLIPAPTNSSLAGCDLLFLRMEQSDQWPVIFQMLDHEFHSIRGYSRVSKNFRNIEEINAIASYELSSEEKISIYNSRGKFVQDWFDAYGYMDDVNALIDVVNNIAIA